MSLIRVKSFHPHTEFAPSEYPWLTNWTDLVPLMLSQSGL